MSEPEMTWYVCFRCLRGYNLERKRVERGGALVTVPQSCPACGMPMQHVGADFVPPAQTDTHAWSIVMRRIQVGELR